MADDGDSTRSGLGRRLALLRVWSAAVTLLPAIGLVPHGGWPLLAVGLVVEAVQAALSFRLVQQIRDGREGELLYVAGGRVPRRMVQTQQLVERVGLGISAVGIVGLTLLATPWTLIHAGLSVVLWATVFLSLRVQWRSTRLLFLLHDHRQEEALALSERWRKGRFGTLLTQLHVIALLMNRRVVEARRLRAEAWNGSVDRAALGIALDRIQTGDLQLARKVVAALSGPDAYARYARALLGGHMALASDDPSFQLDDGLLDALPRVMAVELRLVEGALARRRGDEDRARAMLAPVDLDAESWRAAAYPRLWEALGGRAEASAAAPVAAPADAFAPPSEAAEGPRRRLAGVGAWPAARAPLTVRWNPWVQGLLLLLGLLLLVMALLLAALAFTSDLVGSAVPEEIPSISGYSIAIALFLIVRYGVLRAAARTDRGILLEDDRVLDPTRPVLLQSAVVLPFVSALVIIPALMLSLAALADLWLPVLAFVIGWVLLVLVQGYRRLRLVRLVRAVHVGSDASMASAARGIHRWGQAWAVLAHFLRGRPEEARKAGEHALLVTDDVANLLRWDAAARGDLDVAAVRALPRPAELGPRFAREVALRLAALHQGDPAAVAEPAVDELHLPNRIGDALHVLEHEVQRRLDPLAAQRTATRLAPELRRGAWIQRCWPDLFDD